MADFENTSSDENTSLISDYEDENQLPSEQSKLHDTQKKSKQLRYYHRKTKGRAKRKYTPFSQQENPRRQLKSYHATKEDSLQDSVDPTCFETSSENDDHAEEEMDVNESRFNQYFEDDEMGMNTTSSMDDSDESSSVRIVLPSLKVKTTMSQKRRVRHLKEKPRNLPRRNSCIKAAKSQKFYHLCWS